MLNRFGGMLILALLAWTVAESAPPRVDHHTPSPLIIDPANLDLGTVKGDAPIHATLLIRNMSGQAVAISKLTSSCGCTDLQAEDMVLPAGGFTPLHVTIDPFAKQGKVVKTLTVYDSLGGRSSATISMRVHQAPHANTSGRSILKGACARCHALPAKGIHQGKALYRAVCAMCHGARAEGGYAPPLLDIPRKRLATIIAHGAGTPAMPAFAREQGGPLTRKQISALVHWLSRSEKGRRP